MIGRIRARLGPTRFRASCTKLRGTKTSAEGVPGPGRRPGPQGTARPQSRPPRAHMRPLLVARERLERPWPGARPLATAARDWVTSSELGGNRCRRHRPRQPRPGADEVERRTACAGLLARRRTELTGADARNRLGQLGLEGGKLRPLVRRRHDGVGTFEEVIDDLDLLSSGAEARKRVDEALDAILLLDGLLRRRVLQHVRLVVDDERAAILPMEDVEPAVEEHAVVLERKRPLDRGLGERRDPAGELRVAMGGDEVSDALELFVGDARIPSSNLLKVRWRGIREVDQLEQAVDGVSDLRRGEPRLAWNPATRVRWPEPDDTLRVVAIRAALEEGEGGVRQRPERVQWWRRDLGQLGKPWRGRRQRTASVAREQLELP